MTLAGALITSATFPGNRKKIEFDEYLRKNRAIHCCFLEEIPIYII